MTTDSVERQREWIRELQEVMDDNKREKYVNMGVKSLRGLVKESQIIW